MPGPFGSTNPLPDPLNLTVVAETSRGSGSEVDAVNNTAERADIAMEELRAMQAAISTDGTMAANSDVLIPTQKAVKTFATTGVSAIAATAVTSRMDTDGTLSANSDALIATQKATKTYVDGRTAAPFGTYLDVTDAAYGGISDSNPANDATNGPANAAAFVTAYNAAAALVAATPNRMIWIYIPAGKTIRTGLTDLVGNGYYMGGCWIGGNVGLWVDGNLIQVPTYNNAQFHSSLVMNRNYLTYADNHIRIEGSGTIDGNSPNQPTTGVTGGSLGSYGTTCASGQSLVAKTGRTIAAASNGVNVNTYTGSGVITVDAAPSAYDTQGYLSIPTSGTSPAIITYTGVSGSTFTGCTTQSGTGTLSTGAAVTGSFTLTVGSTAAFHDPPTLAFSPPIVFVAADVAAVSTTQMLSYTATDGTHFYGCRLLSGGGTQTNGSNPTGAFSRTLGSACAQFDYHGGLTNRYVGDVVRIQRADDVRIGEVTIKECAGNSSYINPAGTMAGTPGAEIHQAVFWKCNRVRMYETKIYSSGTSSTGVGAQQMNLFEMHDCYLDGNPTFTPNQGGTLYSNSHGVAVWSCGTVKIFGGTSIRWQHNINVEFCTDVLIDGMGACLYQSASMTTPDTQAPYPALGCIATGGETVNGSFGTLTVNDTHGFAIPTVTSSQTTNTIYVPTSNGVATVTYTGKTNTTFTGCVRTSGGTGTATAGGIVKQTTGGLIGAGEIAVCINGTLGVAGRIHLRGITGCGANDTVSLPFGATFGTGLAVSCSPNTLDELIVTDCTFADNSGKNIELQAGTYTRLVIDPVTVQAMGTNNWITPAAIWRNNNSTAASAQGTLTAGQPVSAAMTPPLVGVSSTNGTQVSPFHFAGTISAFYQANDYLTAAVDNAVTSIPVAELARFTSTTIAAASAGASMAGWTTNNGTLNVQNGTHGFNPKGGTLLVKTTGAVAVVTYTGVAVSGGAGQFTGCNLSSGGTTIAATGQLVCPQMVLMCESEQMQTADVYSAASGAGNLVVATRGTINSTAAAAHPINARITGIGAATLSVGGVQVLQPITATSLATVPIPRSGDTISLTYPNQTLVPEIQYSLAKA